MVKDRREQRDEASGLRPRYQRSSDGTESKLSEGSAETARPARGRNGQRAKLARDADERAGEICVAPQMPMPREAAGVRLVVLWSSPA